MDVFSHLPGCLGVDPRGIVLGHRLVDRGGELVDRPVADERVGLVGRAGPVLPMAADAMLLIDRLAGMVVGNRGRGGRQQGARDDRDQTTDLRHIDEPCHDASIIVRSMGCGKSTVGRSASFPTAAGLGAVGRDLAEVGLGLGKIGDDPAEVVLLEHEQVAGDDRPDGGAAGLV